MARCATPDVKHPIVLGYVVADYSLLLVAEGAMMRIMSFEMAGPLSWV
jgi:hypothetical protein